MAVVNDCKLLNNILKSCLAAACLIYIDTNIKDARPTIRSLSIDGLD